MTFWHAFFLVSGITFWVSKLFDIINIIEKRG